jgi:hypothetical protein
MKLDWIAKHVIATAFVSSCLLLTFRHNDALFHGIVLATMAALWVPLLVLLFKGGWRERLGRHPALGFGVASVQFGLMFVSALRSAKNIYETIAMGVSFGLFLTMMLTSISEGRKKAREQRPVA